MLSPGRARVLRSVKAWEATGVKTHTPVQLSLKANATAFRSLYLRPPPRIPHERLYGPLPPPPSWELALLAARAAVEAASGGDARRAAELMDEAYCVWAAAAEAELEGVTGCTLAKRGLRASRPKLVWRSILGDVKPKTDGHYPVVAVTAWLRGAAGELVRLAEEAVAEEAALAGSGGLETDGLGLGGDTGGGVAAAAGDDHRDDHLESSDDEPFGEPVDMPCRMRGSAVLREISAAIQHDLPAGQPPQEVADFIDAIAMLIDDMLKPTSMALCRKGLRLRALALLENLTLALRAEESAREERELAAWRSWIAQDAGGGARNAHLYSREPEEWQPTEVMTTRGTISSDPYEFLQAMRETYKEKWAAVNTQYHYDWECCQGLTRLTPGELRSSSMEFRKGTTQTYDGFHVRHFALLCDDALDALSHLLLAVEMTGRWPSQIGLVPMPLIPKPKGGYRGIGILPGLYRLWAKARRPMAEAWERDNPRGYLAAAIGSGALGAVWRKAARQEAGVGAGSVAASTLDDLESFYESLSRDRLLEEAEALNFPLPIVRACLAMYAGPRMLLLQGQAARELHPTRGIIAGCAIATTLVNIYYMRAFDNLVKQLPEGVDLEVYIDDVVLSADGDPGEVVSALADARAKLLKVVTEELGCTIAAGKSAVVATNKAVTAKLADACGIPAAATASAVDLGVDITGAKPRSALTKGTKRRARAEAAVRRRSRLRKLAALIGRRATKIYTAGIAPAGLYDTAIWGMDDGELLKSRRMAAETLRPKGRGRSLTALMLINAMPTAKLEVAPAVQYGRMVWRAVAAREEAMRRRTALPDIDAWWPSAHGYFAPAAAAIRSKAAAAGGGGLRATRKLWATARGPIAATAFTIARLGWEFEAPFTMRDDLGREVVLTRTSPRMLRDLLADGVKRAAERTLAAKWGTAQGDEPPRRLCADIAAAAAKGQRLAGYTLVQIGAFRSAACNAVMTNQRAHQGGYDVDDLCPLCGAVGDSVHHRVYHCSATCQTVKAKVPRWFWEEAQRSDPRDRFWVTAIFPHPGDLAAPPAEDIELQFSRGAVGDEAAEAEGPAGMTIEGEIYIDGSCTSSTICGLARAGCAIIQMQGLRVVKKALAAVPDYLPQTAQAAEHLGMALAYRYVAGRSNFMGDCLGVVKALNATMTSMLAKGRRYAGLLADTLRDPGRRRLVQTVRWVKAHRTYAEGMSEQEAMDVAGNNAADAAAKEAVKLHPRLGDEAMSSIEYYEPRA